MSSDSESISTFYMKRTLRRTPAGEQVSYSYRSPRASSSVSTSYSPAYGRSSGTDAAARAAKRPSVSTYRRRKYPTVTPYHIWYVLLFICNKRDLDSNLQYHSAIFLRILTLCVDEITGMPIRSLDVVDQLLLECAKKDNWYENGTVNINYMAMQPSNNFRWCSANEFLFFPLFFF